MCPFCNIGRRRMEEVLQQFDHAEDIKTQPGISVKKYLSEVKGLSLVKAIDEALLKPTLRMQK